MTLVIDVRERKLIETYKGPFTTKTLDVGDVQCKYEDGNEWIMERKTAAYLTRSIKDGRWAEQRDRLMASGRKVIYVIEGDLATVRFPIDSLWGALINANIRRNSFVFRTLDLAETAQLVQILVTKMENTRELPRAWRHRSRRGSETRTSIRCGPANSCAFRQSQKRWLRHYYSISAACPSYSRR